MVTAVTWSSYTPKWKCLVVHGFCVFHESTFAKIKQQKFITNWWSENEARYTVAKIKTANISQTQLFHVVENRKFQCKWYGTQKLIFEERQSSCVVSICFSQASNQCSYVCIFADTDAELRRLTSEVEDLGEELADEVDRVGDEAENVGDKVESAVQEENAHISLFATKNYVKKKVASLNTKLNELRTDLYTNLQVAVRYVPTSCSELASGPPGYYQIRIPSSGETVTVYCDTTTHCCNSMGGWMRVAYLDTTDPTQQCPSGFELKTDPKRVCVRTTDQSCTSIIFSVNEVQYSKVCGQVRGYQDGAPDAFGIWPAESIDDNYVDGVSITYGTSPRQHIWTFAAAFDETKSNKHACPCTKTDTDYTGRVPSFIGNDYFCETGTEQPAEYGMFYHEDPLWDGKGCGPTSSCCQFNSPPSFCKELPQPTTDDIEVRVCTDEVFANEDVAIELIELYLQ